MVLSFYEYAKHKRAFSIAKKITLFCHEGLMTLRREPCGSLIRAL